MNKNFNKNTFLTWASAYLRGFDLLYYTIVRWPQGLVYGIF